MLSLSTQPETRHHADLDQIKNTEFTLGTIDDENEMESSIAAVDNLPSLVCTTFKAKELFEFRCIKKITQSGSASADERIDLLYH